LRTSGAKIALDYMAEMPEPVKVARVAGTVARTQCSDIRE